MDYQCPLAPTGNALGVSLIMHHQCHKVTSMCSYYRKTKTALSKDLIYFSKVSKLTFGYFNHKPNQQKQHKCEKPNMQFNEETQSQFAMDSTLRMVWLAREECLTLHIVYATASACFHCKISQMQSTCHHPVKCVQQRYFVKTL